MSSTVQSTHSPHPVLDAYYSSVEQKRQFVNDLFDRTASNYDRINAVAFLGTGGWYRRSALTRAGLRPGMRLLDVGSGTGAVAQAAARIIDPATIVCCDPCENMLARAAARLPAASMVHAPAERLPFEAGSFDFLTLGYALRHVADLQATFCEFHRVVAPGGRVLILEITKPASWLMASAARLYLRDVVPLMGWLATGDRHAARLMRYFWDTIDACVPPQAIVTHLQQAGFRDVHRRVECGLFAEYTAISPPDPQ